MRQNGQPSQAQVVELTVGAAFHAVGTESGKLRGDRVVKPRGLSSGARGHFTPTHVTGSPVTVRPREQRNSLTCPPYENGLPVPLGMPAKAEHPPALDALESMPAPREIFKVTLNSQTLWSLQAETQPHTTQVPFNELLLRNPLLIQSPAEYLGKLFGGRNTEGDQGF